MRHRGSVNPLLPVAFANDICLELTDHSKIRKSAVDFFQLQKVDQRSVSSQAARQAEHFIAANRRLCEVLEVRLASDYDGSRVSIVVESGSAVGAIPLLSPSSGQMDLGLVVQPRFSWFGLGPMLADMGWRIAPSPLKLPSLHQSERRVPPWVLSSMILARLAALLDSLTRKFEMVHEHRTSPRGSVDWETYIRRQVPATKLLSIPCTFPELQEDRTLKGSIRYTLERQIQSLETQKEHGSFVHRLTEFARSLLARVQSVPICIPSAAHLHSWMRRPMRSLAFLDGLEAIEWTVHERGLAGLSDLQGIPWRMRMDSFFEAWVEMIFTSIARKTGGKIKTGRQRQTTHAIEWRPAYLGSQKSLVPDIWLEWESVTLIVDAKYKRHWEELSQHSWSLAAEEVRGQHRADLFQVLAYANLAKTPSVIACLAYPCDPETWQSLSQANRLIHKAYVAVGSRAVHLWLTAIPMMADREAMSGHFSEIIRPILAA